MKQTTQLFIGAGAALFGAACFIVYAAQAQPQVVSAWVAAASLCAATAGWMFTQAINISAQLRSKAFDFLKAAESDSELLSAIYVVGRASNFANNREHFADGAMVRQFYFDRARSGDFLAALRQAMNFFDEMGLAVRLQAADEALLRDYYSGQLCRIYEIYEPFEGLMKNIPVTQGHLLGRRQRPELFVDAAWLHRRWYRTYGNRYFRRHDWRTFTLT